MRRAALGIGGVATAVFAAASLAAVIAPALPIEARVFVPQGSNVTAIRFTGRLPTSAAGERVTIEMRECTYQFYRQIATGATVAGGGWEIVIGGPHGSFGQIGLGASYRARWKGRFSAPWTFRSRITPGVRPLGNRRFRVTIVNGGFGTPLQNLGGKPVVLERLSDGRFVRVRTLRLRTVDARTFTATFTVATSGLTLRVLVPTRTARPCYNAGVSSVFRS